MSERLRSSALMILGLGQERLIQSFTKTTRLRLFAAAIIPVIAAIATYSVLSDSDRGHNVVKQGLLLRISLERVQSDLHRAESVQRAYLETGDDSFLSSYRSMVESILSQVAGLDYLTGDSRRLQEGIARVKILVSERLADMQRGVELYQAGQSDGTSDAARNIRGLQIMNSIRSAISGLEVDDEGLLAERELAWARARNRLSWLLISGYVLGVVILGSLYLVSERYSKQVSAVEHELLRMNTDLEQRVNERTISLRQREELLTLFARYVPVAAAMFDRQMTYLEVSDRWCSDFQVDRSSILGRSHYEVLPDIPQRWRDIHQRGLAGEHLRADEDLWQREHSPDMWLRWEVRPWGDINGLPEGVVVFCEDITGRKKIEQALREEEATTRTLLDTAAQAILTVEENGAIVMANRMAADMFRYPHGYLPGKPVEILLPKSLALRHAVHRAAFNASPDRRPMGIGLDLRAVRNDGSEFPVEISISYVDAARGRLTVAFITDITARCEAERALKASEQELRNLTASLLTASEQERRRISRELHDDLTQQLAGLSIEIGKNAASDDLSLAEARKFLTAIQSQLYRIANEVRRLSHGLHPFILEDLGLSAALESLCEEVSELQGLSVSFSDLSATRRPPIAIASCLYRIAQEAIRNAVRHGQASQVRVSLVDVNGAFSLHVADNGRGFAANPATPSVGLGIVSMKERTRLIGGTLTIDSSPNTGTEVTASVPLSNLL